MANTFKSIDELKHYLENMVNAALDNDVSKLVVEGLEYMAEADVYDVYPSPVLYNRRGSLTLDENYEVDKSQNLKVKITPVAKFNAVGLRWNKRTRSYVPTISSNVGDELAGLINYGDGWNGYNYEYVTDEERENPTYTAPRPFIDDTREMLADGTYKEYLADSLRSLGIKVK